MDRHMCGTCKGGLGAGRQGSGTGEHIFPDLGAPADATDDAMTEGLIVLWVPPA